MNFIQMLGQDFETNSQLANADYKQLESLVSFNLPVDYLRFMEKYDGGEGPVGKENYLAIFSAKEAFEHNSFYYQEYSASSLFVFASDRGNTLYAFNKAQEVLEFDKVGIEPDQAMLLAPDFISFLKKL
jgi:hypothetical protein